MKALPDKTLEHYCALHPIAMRNPDSPIDVSGINPSCIRAMYTRGLIEYEFLDTNGKSARRILFTKKGLKYGCEELALVPDDNSDNRKREVLRVYLDMGNEDHKRAWNVARSLAGERILTPTLVDLLLMHSDFLRQEDTTFAEAYPGMYKLMTETRQGDLLQRLEGLLQNAPIPANMPANNGLQANGVSSQANGLKRLNVPQFEVPTYDDDNDDLLEVTKDTSNTANQNFLKSMMALQGIEYKE